MSWIKSTILVIAMATLTLKVADVSFGKLKPKNEKREKRAWLDHSKRTVHLRELAPNQKAIVTPADAHLVMTDGIEKRGYRIETDSDGFISNSNGIKATGDEIRIAFLGGSTTATTYVTEKNRFPSFVERSLNDLQTERVVTFNAGVPGNNSLHSLINFQAKVLPKEVHIAVLMHSINDLALLVKTGSYWDAPVSKSIVLNERKVPQSMIVKSVLRSFKVFKVLRSFKNVIFPNLYEYLRPRLISNSNVDEFAGYRERYLPVSEVDIIKQFERSLISFVALCNAWDVKPVLMTQFSRIDINDNVFQQWIVHALRGFDEKKLVKLYNDFNETTRRVALTTGTHIIDLDKEVPKNSEHIYDVVHLNDKGSLLVGEIVSRELMNILSTNLKK